MSPRWLDFANFVADIGEKPAGTIGRRSAFSIGRLSESRGFEPGNVLWVKRHGHSRKTPNSRKTPTYSTWSSMRQRCNDRRHLHFSDYGGRGIKICERWDDFSNFLADMGERPGDTSLDRIDPNGNYEPANCQWATRIEQCSNKRLSTPRVAMVLDAYAAEAPDLIARLRRDLLG
ncbi:MAG: hypothetical protein M3R55_10195 [Acidobacteriota bacterium]|nr:hypothetical protein [Acidobacteriota bacterium]